MYVCMYVYYSNRIPTTSIQTYVYICMYVQGQYVDFPVTDVLQMMGRAGRPQFDETGVACIFVHEPKKNFYRKFLHEPFPVV